MKDNIKLMKLVFDFLDKLSESQINELLTKKSKLKVEKLVKEDKEMSNNEMEKIDNIYKDLVKVNTREEAIALLESNKLNKKELKILASSFKVLVNSKDSNQIIIKKIVEAAIGSKIKFNTLLKGN